MTIFSDKQIYLWETGTAEYRLNHALPYDKYEDDELYGDSLPTEYDINVSDLDNELDDILFRNQLKRNNIYTANYDAINDNAIDTRPQFMDYSDDEIDTRPQLNELQSNVQNMIRLQNMSKMINTMFDALTYLQQEIYQFKI